MERHKPSGIYPAIPIPLLDDYSLDEPSLKTYVQWLAEQGVSGVVTNGHTGEINALTREERARVTEVCVEALDGRLPVYSGVSAEGTLEAIAHARDAQSAGAQGILLMPPHQWLRFGMKPETPSAFFRDVAQSIDIDIIVHLYPAWTKAFYPVEARLEMAQLPNVTAIKDGTREMARYQRDVRRMRTEAPEVSILTCHDEYLLPTMIFGIDGALVGFGSLVPELITGLWDAVKRNDLVEARAYEDKLLPLKLAVYGMGEPSGDAHARLKEALVQRGLLPSGLMRPPVPALSEDEKSAIADALVQSGISAKPAGVA